VFIYKIPKRSCPERDRELWCHTRKCRKRFITELDEKEALKYVCKKHSVEVGDVVVIQSPARPNKFFLKKESSFELYLNNPWLLNFSVDYKQWTHCHEASVVH